jgi:hypothetical protein
MNILFLCCQLGFDFPERNFATTAADGKIYNVDYYNLDVIISVGYRVKSKRGVIFRQWATKTLKEYILKTSFWNIPFRLCYKLNELLFYIVTAS